ncbi:MAG: HXXEE domain-containing protein [Bacteroidetes bacterium]|nr:HXXEE domain-containing protein [Bacteroidota bacterium]
MNFLRNHWFDIGFIFGCSAAFYLILNPEFFGSLKFILWFNFASLFFHQFEEYRYPGYFPGLINEKLFSSRMPDRFPLNTNSALIVNVCLGWTVYFIAIFIGEKYIWFAIGVTLISVGNFFAHTIMFNIKAKTIYNPGMLTSILLFLPGAGYFFYFISKSNLASPFDYIIGLLLGFIFNYFGIIKIIEWMKDENTKYIFPQHCLPPGKN